MSFLQVNVASPINTAPQPSPAAATPPLPAQVENAPPALDLRRDTDSPGTIRPFPSITEFIEDPCAKLGTPERIPSPPKAPIVDLLNPQSSNVLRPPSTSPLESEGEEEPQNSRLVSIEEFLRQDQEPSYSSRQQVHSELLTTKIISDVMLCNSFFPQKFSKKSYTVCLFPFLFT